MKLRMGLKIGKNEFLIKTPITDERLLELEERAVFFGDGITWLQCAATYLSKDATESALRCLSEAAKCIDSGDLVGRTMLEVLTELSICQGQINRSRKSIEEKLSTNPELKHLTKKFLLPLKKITL